MTREPKIIVEIGHGIWRVVAFRLIQRIVAEKEGHAVELTNGAVIRGKILTTAIDADTRRYDLHSTRELVVQTPRPAKKLRAEAPGSLITLAQPPYEKMVVFRPRFSDGPYNLTESFHMLVNGDSLQGNLSDFEKVSLNGTPRRWEIAVKLPGAPPTTGILDRNTLWLIAGETSDGTVVVFDARGCPGLTIEREVKRK
jgi:hypothetical protein